MNRRHYYLLETRINGIYTGMYTILAETSYQAMFRFRLTVGWIHDVDIKPLRQDGWAT